MNRAPKWMVDKRDAAVILDAIDYAAFSWHRYCHDFPGLPTVVQTGNLHQILLLINLYQKYIRRWKPEPPDIFRAKVGNLLQMRECITKYDTGVFLDHWHAILHRLKGEKGA